MISGFGERVDFNLGSIALHEDLIPVSGWCPWRPQYIAQEKPSSVAMSCGAISSVTPSCGYRLEIVMIASGCSLATVSSIHTSLRGCDDDLVRLVLLSVHEHGQVKLSPCELSLHNIDCIAKPACSSRLLCDEFAGRSSDQRGWQLLEALSLYSIYSNYEELRLSLTSRQL